MTSEFRAELSLSLKADPDSIVSTTTMGIAMRKRNAVVSL
jgi:hypothetical protein